jgi:hypothetical protein
MLSSRDYTVSSLANSLQDLLRRRRLARDTAVQLALETQALVDEDWGDLPREEIAWSFATRVRALGNLTDGTARPETPPLDYVALLEEKRH